MLWDSDRIASDPPPPPRAGILPDDEIGNPIRGVVFALIITAVGFLVMYGAISLALDIARALGLPR